MRDLDVREALMSLLRSQYAFDPTTLIIQEMGLCQGEVRVDVAVINGKIHGFEIKSDRDTLLRLDAQQQAYNKVLDSVTLVAGGKHLAKVEDQIPSWWGLCEARYENETLTINEIRDPKANPHVDPLAVVQLLWKDEALAILRKHGMDKGLRTKARNKLWATLVEVLDRGDLLNTVRECLKARQAWRPAG